MKEKKKNIHEGDDWNDFKKYFLSPEELAEVEADAKAFGKRFRARQEKLAKIEAAKQERLKAKEERLAQIEVVKQGKLSDKEIVSSGGFYSNGYAMSAGGRGK